MKQTRGLWRTKTEESGATYAYVDYESYAQEVTEAMYRDRGYQPPYDELPTKEEYDGQSGG